MSTTSDFCREHSGELENTTRTISMDQDSGGKQLSPEEIRILLGGEAKGCITDYTELKTIGLGGFGAIYSAKEPGLERKLALKILRPRFRQKEEQVSAFIREARTTAQIAHPNIVPVHRLGVFEDAGIYFSMKKVAGETLRSILIKLNRNQEGYRKKYTLTRLMDIFIGACRGVAYAHHNGIVHCDLKPENLMVGDFGEVLVMDWGVAHYLPELDQAGNSNLAECHRSYTKLGGTPVFMAPETLSLSRKEPAAALDIYALGCILYTILSWKSAPFSAEGSLEEIQKRVVLEDPEPPRHIPPPGREIPRELEAICLKAMAKRPEERYASVEEMMADISSYREGFAVTAYSPSFTYRFSKMVFRHPMIPAALVIALIIWFAFALFISMDERMQIMFRQTLAENNFQSGQLCSRRAKRLIDSSRHNFSEAATRRKQQEAIARNITEARSYYNSALEFIARLPEKQQSKHGLNRLVGLIFRDLYTLYIHKQDDEALLALGKVFSGRWGEMFQRAAVWDPRLNRMRQRILAARGRVRVYGNSPIVGETILTDRNQKQYRLSAGEKVELDSGLPACEIRLPQGVYEGKLALPGKRVIRFPLRVSTTATTHVQLLLPSRIPEDMVFIPGGEFSHEPSYSSGFRSRSFEPAFLIRNTEVTIGEYLNFWKSLSPALKSLYAGYYTIDPGSMRSGRLWDDEGKILKPGVTLKHPVSGISPAAAEAFCAYLGRKLGCRVSLPTHLQWLKAAGGVDGHFFAWGNKYVPGAAQMGAGSAFSSPVGSFAKDISPYGVRDMSGNVREMVTTDSSRSRYRYGAVGGSYATPPLLSRNTQITYLENGMSDLGFRYVIAIPGADKALPEE